jgi:hypothetical protein
MLVAPRVLSVTLLAVALLPAACVTAAKNVRFRTELALEGRSVVEPGDTITIVPGDGARCIGKSLHELQPDLRIIEPDQFRRAAFAGEPDDRVSFAYPVAEAQQQLLSTDGFRDRIAPLHLRYLVSIGETTAGGSKSSSPPCGGGGCFFNWSQSQTVTASAFDLKDGREVGRIVVDVTGGRTLALVGPIPVFFSVEMIHGPACRALGEALGRFLGGQPLR